MAVLRDNKELIEFGAKLELAGRAEAAAELYLTYVNELARLSDGGDVLVWLYGKTVYQNPPRRYTEALEWGFIATAAVSLLETVRARFPSPDWTTDSGRADSAVSAFFTWQAKASVPHSADFELISRMKRVLDKKDKLVLTRSSAAARKTLEEIIGSVGARKTRYENGKLY